MLGNSGAETSCEERSRTAAFTNHLWGVFVEEVQQSACLLTTEEVSRFLRVHQVTLRRWRSTDCGPRFVRIHGLVRYRKEDIETYITANLRPEVA
jgi:predicted DNA-binding transcriptional regulator AlpA